jgi:hypothetical protein
MYTYILLLNCTNAIHDMVIQSAAIDKTGANDAVNYIQVVVKWRQLTLSTMWME